MKHFCLLFWLCCLLSIPSNLISAATTPTSTITTTQKQIVEKEEPLEEEAEEDEEEIVEEDEEEVKTLAEEEVEEEAEEDVDEEEEVEAEEEEYEEEDIDAEAEKVAEELEKAEEELETLKEVAEEGPPFSLEGDATFDFPTEKLGLPPDLLKLRAKIKAAYEAGKVSFEASVDQTIDLKVVRLGNVKIKVQSDGTAFLEGSAKIPVINETLVGRIALTKIEAAQKPRRGRKTQQPRVRTRRVLEFIGRLKKDRINPLEYIPGVKKIPGIDQISLQKPYIRIRLGAKPEIAIAGTAELFGVAVTAKAILGTNRITIIARPSKVTMPFTQILPELKHINTAIEQSGIANLLKDQMIVLSSHGYYDSDFELDIKKGITILSKASIKQIPVVNKIWDWMPIKPPVTSLIFSINIGPAIKKSRLEAIIKTDISLIPPVIDPKALAKHKGLEKLANIPQFLKMDHIAVFLGGTGQFGIEAGLSFIPPVSYYLGAQQERIKLVGEISLDVRTQSAAIGSAGPAVKIAGSMVGEWNRPLGVPLLKMKDLAFELSIGWGQFLTYTGPMLFSLGMTGMTTLGEQAGEATVMVDVKDPLSAALIVKLNQLTLKDIFTLLPRAVGVSVPTFFIPTFGFKDMELTFVPTTASVGAITKDYPAGLTMRGKMDVFGKQAEIDMRLLWEGDDAGIICKGRMDKINLGPFLVDGAGPDKEYGTEDDGPIISTEITAKKQEFILSGFTKFATEKAQLDIFLDKKGLRFNTDFSLMGQKIGLQGKSPSFDPQDWSDLSKLKFELTGHIGLGDQDFKIHAVVSPEPKESVFVLHLNRVSLAQLGFIATTAFPYAFGMISYSVTTVAGAPVAAAGSVPAAATVGLSTPITTIVGTIIGACFYGVGSIAGYIIGAVVGHVIGFAAAGVAATIPVVATGLNVAALTTGIVAGYAGLGTLMLLDKIPDIRFENINLGIVLKKTTFEGKTYEPGFTGEGKMTFPFGIGPDLNVYFNLASKGFEAEASAPRFTLGPLLITGKGRDETYGTEDDGAIARIDLTNKKQQVMLSGLVQLFDDIANIEFMFGMKGVTFDTKLSLFNKVLTVDLHGKSKGDSAKNIRFDLAGDVKFANQVAKARGIMGLDPRHFFLGFNLNQVSLAQLAALGVGIAGTLAGTAAVGGAVLGTGAVLGAGGAVGTTVAAGGIGAAAGTAGVIGIGGTAGVGFAKITGAEKPLTTAATAATRATSKALEEVLQAVDKFPDVKFKNLHFGIGLKKVRFAGKEYPPGVSFGGEMELPFGPTASLEGSIGSEGILAEGKVTKFYLGPILVTGKGPDATYGTDDDGPVARLEISKKKQQLLISGIVVHGENKGQIELVIDKNGIRFDATLKLFDLFDATIKGRSEGTNIKTASFDIVGTAKFADQEAKLFGRLGVDPFNTVIGLEINRIGLQQLALMSASAALSFAALPAGPVVLKQGANIVKQAMKILDQMPDVRFKNIEWSLAHKEITLEGKKYPHGVSFKGTMELPFGPSTTVHGALGKDGLIIRGTMSEIAFGLMKITGTGFDEKKGTPDDGPVVKLELTKDPNIFIDGEVDVLGALSKTTINVKKDGFTFAIERNLGGLFKSKLLATSIGSGPDIDFILRAEHEEKFLDELKNMNAKTINSMVSGIREKLAEAQDKVAAIDKELKPLDDKINERKEQIRKFKADADRRIEENKQKIEDAKNKLRKAEEKVRQGEEQIRKAEEKMREFRDKVRRQEDKCNDLDHWYSKPAYWACKGVLGGFRRVLQATEQGAGVTARAAQKVVEKALELARGFLDLTKNVTVLDPRGLKEAALISKLGIEIGTLEAAKAPLIALRETAVLSLEALKSITTGMGEVGKLLQIDKPIATLAGIADQVVNVDKATLFISLKDLATGVLPQVQLEGKIFGKQKTLFFHFDLKDPIKAIAKLSQKLIKTALGKVDNAIQQSKTMTISVAQRLDAFEKEIAHAQKQETEKINREIEEGKNIEAMYQGKKGTQVQVDPMALEKQISAREEFAQQLTIKAKEEAKKLLRESMFNQLSVNTVVQIKTLRNPDKQLYYAARHVKGKWILKADAQPEEFATLFSILRLQNWIGFSSVVAQEQNLFSNPKTYEVGINGTDFSDPKHTWHHWILEGDSLDQCFLKNEASGGHLSNRTENWSDLGSNTTWTKQHDDKPAGKSSYEALSIEIIPEEEFAQKRKIEPLSFNDIVEITSVHTDRKIWTHAGSRHDIDNKQPHPYKDLELLVGPSDDQRTEDGCQLFMLVSPTKETGPLFYGVPIEIIPLKAGAGQLNIAGPLGKTRRLFTIADSRLGNKHHEIVVASIGNNDTFDGRQRFIINLPGINTKIEDAIKTNIPVEIRSLASASKDQKLWINTDSRLGNTYYETVIGPNSDQRTQGDQALFTIQKIKPNKIPTDVREALEIQPAGILNIIHATYGLLKPLNPQGKETKNVTFLIQKQVTKNGLIQEEKENWMNTLFGDPAPGKAKQLEIFYKIGDKTNTIIIDENKAINISTKKEEEKKQIPSKNKPKSPQNLTQNG